MYAKNDCVLFSKNHIFIEHCVFAIYRNPLGLHRSVEV